MGVLITEMMRMMQKETYQIPSSMTKMMPLPGKHWPGGLHESTRLVKLVLGKVDIMKSGEGCFDRLP